MIVFKGRFIIPRLGVATPSGGGGIFNEPPRGGGEKFSMSRQGEGILDLTYFFQLTKNQCILVFLWVFGNFLIPQICSYFLMRNPCIKNHLSNFSEDKKPRTQIFTAY